MQNLTRILKISFVSSLITLNAAMADEAVVESSAASPTGAEVVQSVATVQPVAASAETQPVQVVRSSTITPGYYTDDKGGHQLFIKEVVENNFASYYAVILWKAKFVSIYRIEDVDGASQAWINLYQDSNNNLASNISQTATYEVIPLRLGNELSLRFAWTHLASSIGRDVPCSIVPNFKFKGQGKSWGSFAEVAGNRYQGQRIRKTATPATDGGLKLSKNMELILSPNANSTWNIIASNMIIETLNPKDWVNPAINKTQRPQQTIYNGNFIGTELIPGLMIAQRKQLDSMTTSGVAVADEVSMFILPIFSGGRSKSLDSLYAVRMAPEVIECAYVRAEIK